MAVKQLIRNNFHDFYQKIWKNKKSVVTLHPQTHRNGSLAEWLGTGLQNRLQQFDSARNLP